MGPKNQRIAPVVVAGMALIQFLLAVRAASMEIRPVLGETNGVVTVNYRSDDDDDSPASNQAFHCGALIAAKDADFTYGIALA